MSDPTAKNYVVAEVSPILYGNGNLYWRFTIKTPNRTWKNGTNTAYTSPIDRRSKWYTTAVAKIRARKVKKYLSAEVEKIEF